MGTVRIDGHARRRLIQWYGEGLSSLRIAELLGVHCSSVCNHLRKLGLTRNSAARTRRYKLDETAFAPARVLVDPDAQYWVGLLMADGCVRRSVRQTTVCLSLQEADRSLVELFRNFLKSTNPVRVEKNHGYPGSTSQAILLVTSRLLADDLATYGVIPRKSAREAVTSTLLRSPSFWRGMVDGDGWLGWQKQKSWRLRPRIGLTGGLTIVEQFRDFVASLAPSFRSSILANHSIWKLTVTGEEAAILARTLYGTLGPSLSRKQAIANELMGWGRVHKDRSPISLEVLDGLKAELGTWRAVAAALGFPTPNAVACHRSRLAQERQTGRRRP